jgi:hypothetical protein
MEIAKVYDNGGQTFDRYTITFKDSSDALGLSENCDSPQGFSQFGVAVDGRHLGRQISFEDLPENVKRHTNQRIRQL